MKKIYLIIFSIFIGINVFSQDCTPIGWGNYQWPPSGTLTSCTPYTVYAQVWKSGVTDIPGPSTTMSAWIGVSIENTPPSTWAESKWFPATYNVQVGNNDEYKYDILNLPIGNFYIASRFRNDCSPFYYGGTGGPWNSDSATLTTTENCSLSLDEFDNYSVTIYPNPSNDYITILTKSELKNVEIYNMLGQSINKKISADSRIDISTLPNGNYIIKTIDFQDNQTVLKFIKK
jgi:hypothetical protein